VEASPPPPQPNSNKIIIINDRFFKIVFENCGYLLNN
jgi:hypothetical protein